MNGLARDLRLWESRLTERIAPGPCDKRADAGHSIIANPYIYALSLAVYCTAWTFYGSVGRAATSGIGFLLPSAREQTRVAVSTPSDLSRGDAQGIAVTTRGRLALAPRIERFGKAPQIIFFNYAVALYP